MCSNTEQPQPELLILHLVKEGGLDNNSALDLSNRISNLPDNLGLTPDELICSASGLIKKYGWSSIVELTSDELWFMLRDEARTEHGVCMDMHFDPKTFTLKAHSPSVIVVCECTGCHKLLLMRITNTHECGFMVEQPKFLGNFQCCRAAPIPKKVVTINWSFPGR